MVGEPHDDDRHVARPGERDLATRYAGYYERAWSYFLSGWRDTEAGRNAFAHAIRTIELGGTIGARTAG